MAAVIDGLSEYTSRFVRSEQGRNGDFGSWVFMKREMTPLSHARSLQNHYRRIKLRDFVFGDVSSTRGHREESLRVDRAPQELLRARAGYVLDLSEPRLCCSRIHVLGDDPALPRLTLQESLRALRGSCSWSWNRTNLIIRSQPCLT